MCHVVRIDFDQGLVSTDGIPNALEPPPDIQSHPGVFDRRHSNIRCHLNWSSIWLLTGRRTDATHVVRRNEALTEILNLTKSGRRAVYVQVVWLFAPRLNGMFGVLALETESARRRRFPVVQKYFTPAVGAVLMSPSTVVVVAPNC
jgi:hypothetical protein